MFLLDSSLNHDCDCLFLGQLSLLTFERNSISALEAFVSAAKKLPQEDVYDVVEGYIKISVECAEIFQVLSGEKRPENEVCYSSPGMVKRRKNSCCYCVKLDEEKCDGNFQDIASFL